MRSSIAAAAILAAGPVLAQVNNTFIAGLANTLAANNLTSLLGAISGISNTTAGTALYSALSTGKPYTLFAPNNNAWTGVNPIFSNSVTWLEQAIAYHVLPGTIDTSAVLAAPNSTIYPTALSDPSLVKLLPGQTQNIALQRVGGKVHVSNQNSPGVVVVNSTSYQSITIHIISAVIDLPPDVVSLLTVPGLTDYTANTTILTSLLNGASLTSTVAASKSITFFAPINQAFVDAVASGHISSNSTPAVFNALALNHIINGTIVTTGGAQKNYTSAGGQEITVGTGGLDDGTGSVVYYRGQQVANIVHGNVITQNGIVHYIDAVLPNSASKAPAARRRAASRMFANRT